MGDAAALLLRGALFQQDMQRDGGKAAMAKPVTMSAARSGQSACSPWSSILLGAIALRLLLLIRLTL